MTTADHEVDTSDMRPLSLYLYNWPDLPRRSLNFLARALSRDQHSGFADVDLFPVVDDPSIADCVLVPCDINWFSGREELLQQRLHLVKTSIPHITIDSRDEPTTFRLPGVSLKVSVLPESEEPGVICIPYVDSLRDLPLVAKVPELNGKRFGLSFVGADYRNRGVLTTKISARAPFTTHFELRPACFLDRHLNASAQPYNATEAAARRRARANFVLTAIRSRYMLVLPGYAANTSRFFEALSLGVAPVLVTDGCQLPFPSQIPYSEFCSYVPASDEDVAGAVIAAVVERWDDADHRGRLAREYYNTYLGPRGLLRMLHTRIRGALNGIECS